MVFNNVKHGRVKLEVPFKETGVVVLLYRLVLLVNQIFKSCKIGRR